MSNGKFWAKKIVGFIVCGVAIAALLGWIVKELWNCILVPVIGVGSVTFWQALGILALSKILFGGFHKKKEWGGGKCGPEMKEKWNNMSPEEKEQFKQQWRNKCSTWGRRKNEPEAGTE